MNPPFFSSSHAAIKRKSQCKTIQWFRICFFFFLFPPFWSLTFYFTAVEVTHWTNNSNSFFCGTFSLISQFDMICGCAILYSPAKSFISSPPYTHITHSFVKVHNILTAAFLWIWVHLDPDRHPLVYLPQHTLHSVPAHANTHTDTQLSTLNPSFALSLHHSYTWRRMHTHTQYRCERWYTPLLTQPNRNIWKDTFFFFFFKSFIFSLFPSLALLRRAL